MRLSGTVHLHLACTGTTAHTDVFQGTAESGSLMAFEMSQGNKYICIHDRRTDLCLFHILTVDWHKCFICSL